jgi:hypothetical protein
MQLVMSVATWFESLEPPLLKKNKTKKEKKKLQFADNEYRRYLVSSI